MRNVAASVRQRLLNVARRQQRPFQEVLQFYAMERFLYRLSRSAYADRFILKGALMLHVWETSQSRPTMDIDMLGRIENEPEALLSRVRHILETSDLDDGIVFDSASLVAERITEEAEYEGVRIRCHATLDRARIRLQLDIGFGDIVEPEPEILRYPVLLDFPEPEILCYSRESTIAEKFQAMISLGELNTRMKDFYDIWLLSRQFSFDMSSLAGAITATFDQRGTSLPERPLFNDQLSHEKQAQWSAFLRRLGHGVPAEQDFSSVLTVLERFLGETIDFLDGHDVAQLWPAGGPWQPG